MSSHNRNAQIAFEFLRKQAILTQKHRREVLDSRRITSTLEATFLSVAAAIYETTAAKIACDHTWGEVHDMLDLFNVDEESKPN